MVVGSYVVDKIARLTENRMWQVVDSGVLSPFDLVTSLFYTCITSQSVFYKKKKNVFLLLLLILIVIPILFFSLWMEATRSYK